MTRTHPQLNGWCLFAIVLSFKFGSFFWDVIIDLLIAYWNRRGFISIEKSWLCMFISNNCNKIVTPITEHLFLSLQQKTITILPFLLKSTKIKIIKLHIIDILKSSSIQVDLNTPIYLHGHKFKILTLLWHNQINLSLHFLQI